MVNEPVVDVPHLATHSNAVIPQGHVENIRADRHQTLGASAVHRRGAAHQTQEHSWGSCRLRK